MSWPAQLGSMADMIAAFGAVAAVVAASIAARAAIRTNNQQNRQIALIVEREAKNDALLKRRQADQVAAWAKIDRERGRPTVQWVNRSGLPVYNLDFWVTLPPFDAVRVSYKIGPPDAEVRSLRRVDSAVHKSALEGGPNVHWAALLDSGQLRAALSFQDIHGVWWFRDFMGVLHECVDEQAVNSQAEVQVARISGRVRNTA